MGRLMVSCIFKCRRKLFTYIQCSNLPKRKAASEERVHFMGRDEERLLRMHARAKEIRMRRARTSLRVLGTVYGILMILLIAVMHRLRYLHNSVMTVQNMGSSMLSESTGAYVLVAVIAFTLGATITILAYRYRNRDKHK
jgi:predicted anti-sigma-YlaC factor YlaD